jgi:hypothetical protein
VTWREKDDNEASWDAVLKIAISPDGERFSSPVTIPAPTGTITTGEPRPTVAVDSNGRIYVQFYARKSDGANALDQWAPYLGLLTPDGRLERSLRLSSEFSDGQGGYGGVSRSTWLGDFAGVAASGTTIHVAFSENRFGDADVFYAVYP